ncbi:1-deoxy-D-xylulose-5-phosphate reductoisomerase [candidate division KSB1 bacterium]|nr:1-deoxy-D-xylulose-5-phosphate reductoisomerase [candidate division KSB1 bacterium]
MKKLALLGSTGSIGQNTLDVAERLKDEFRVTVLAAHSRVSELLQQCRRFRPQIAVVSGITADRDLEKSFAQLGVELLCGADALEKAAQQADFDLMVNALVGAAGFMPTLAALRRGKDIALANKETLVVGGELIIQAAADQGAAILPIDSEHSAVFQCLMGEDPKAIQKIVLTASGGPFRDLPAEEFPRIRVQDALRHPNWSMGQKITIDSATLMNKGLEVIEAHWLFGVEMERVQVVVHPQSIIHSMVEFIDGSIKAQLGLPDMRLPIQLALLYPRRLDSGLPRFSFAEHNQLTFEEPDLDKFRCLDLALKAGKAGGTLPAVLNAANEIAVQAFLHKRIRFDQIPCLIEEALIIHRGGGRVDAANLLAADKWARRFVEERVQNFS